MLSDRIWIKEKEPGIMADIMVIDDVLDAGILIKKILERKGHNVVVFTEEEDAVEHVKNNKVDLAILDIKLKKMSGVELLEELRKIDPELKVIMLTGYPTMETAQESLRLGASEYLLKPIDIEELTEKTEHTLGLNP